MARRKPQDPEVSLFPFLSVLAAVMGTLILIIAGMSQIALARPRQGVDVDAFTPGKKTPIFVECRKKGLLIHPDDPMSGKAIEVSRAELEDIGSPWHTLRSRLELDNSRYLMLLVRPDGVGTFNDARESVSGLNIDVGYEPLFGDGDIRFRKRAGSP
ncbi:MAG: hypothetical protein JNK04_06060 [Myxococcales bacterium]|nr:hypothetical protein [Myxococcales bacterium]